MGIYFTGRYKRLGGDGEKGVQGSNPKVEKV